MQLSYLLSVPYFNKKASPGKKTPVKSNSLSRTSQKAITLFTKKHYDLPTITSLTIKQNIHLIVLFVLIFTFITYYTTASFARFDNYYTGRYDLGNMTQVVWNTAHGNLFQMTYENGTETISRLSVHADFILMLFAPLYWIWESPKVLLLVQSVVTGLGAYFVYAIAQLKLQNKNLALAFSGSYLLYPALGWTILFDFHAVALATTFLLGTTYFLLKKRYFLFIVFAILAAITKEQVWFVIALFGPILFFNHKQKLFGTLVFIVSIGLFYYLLWHAIPNAAQSNGHFALSYFNSDAESPSAIIKQSLFHPVATLSKIFSGDRLDYLNQLFMPVGYLSLLFPFWLIFASADFGLNLLSDKSELYEIYYHYTAIITPFIFISAIYGLWVVKHFFPILIYNKLGLYIAAARKRKLAQAGILLAVVIIVISSLWGAYQYGPLPYTQAPNDEMFTMPLDQRKEFDAILSRIPVDKSVASSNELGAQLSHREHIYSMAIDIREADYVAFFMRNPDQDEIDFNNVLINQLNNDSEFKKWYDNNDLLIYRKVN